ncbi:hypothetical protein PF005_g18768 [Phytophthora fragariae]|uniref:Uncharacterized protein n=1 Tax=Phytophthora fragariae TaxID=53985 RepID=A0A6A3J9Y0_9STRA|nr:hypothetical protein PF009_g19600 [Phytophthora fragariae]KAE8992056.1 hypothetical protein PF011_g17694 [Phytophthora fragariae]KAE9078618.1 hypothetical protein PF007_g23780 [Phytophthora fragariae]KAE9089725.1 hypothetical protein PF010_g18878 [Phytophthora fragariae]KAE9120090.1 hypothetical protein PF006_g18212 [Phytophthora fragariae]
MALHTVQVGDFLSVPREILWYQSHREVVHFEEETSNTSASEYACGLAAEAAAEAAAAAAKAATASAPKAKAAPAAPVLRLLSPRWLQCRMLLLRPLLRKTRQLLHFTFCGCFLLCA